MILAAELPDEMPIDLYFCIACRSVSSPTAPPSTFIQSVEWHLSVEERNRAYSRSLFEDLGIDHPVVLEVGCGTGTLIACAHEMGGGGIGYDIDAPSCAYGRTLGLDLRAEEWTAESEVPAVNLIVCIMVLEHIHQPRPLLGELILASRAQNCPLFISVPFFHKFWWHYLFEPVGTEFHPFALPRVHVSHFSPEGFEEAATSLGARSVKSMLNRNGWPGYLLNGPE